MPELKKQKDIEAMGYSVTIVSDIQSLCLQCHFIITTTSSTTPLIMNDWVQPGTHITAVYSEASGAADEDTQLSAVESQFEVEDSQLEGPPLKQPRF